MKKSDSVKTVLGITLLFTIIVSVFLLLSKLTELLIPEPHFNQTVRLFLGNNLPWIIISAGIIAILNIYMKKLNQSFSDLLNSKIICRATGILVILEGILNLAIVLPGYIKYITNATTLERNISPPYGTPVHQIITNAIYADVISVVVVLCQIIFAIYLLKRSKKVLSHAIISIINH